MTAIGRSARAGAARGAACHALPLLLAAALLSACRTAEPPAQTGGIVDEETPSELRAPVTALMPALERLSGLDRLETVRVRRQSREDARAYVARRLEQEMPVDVREGARRTYVALGLVPDTLDLDALLLDLYTEQVLGYYDPHSRTLFVVEGAAAAALTPVLAHELVHALQDQHTDLDSLVARERGNDRQTAAHAAMEGHAMMVMFAILAEQAAGRDVDPATLPSPATELGPALAAQNEQFPVFRRAPRVVRETLLFPYLRGADFVHTLWSAVAPMERYPAPIDSLLPQSTEQVIRPLERFIRQRDEPVNVRFAEDDVPAGRVIYENTFGQLETALFLAEHLGEEARSLANGWDGDRYRLVEDPQLGDVLHWISVWDSPADADAFAQAVGRTADLRTGRRIAVERADIGGQPAVRISDAPASAPASASPPTD